MAEKQEGSKTTQGPAGRVVESGQVLAEQVIDLQRKIVLAGLGAFANLQGDRTGMFDSLVEAGEKAQAAAQDVVDAGATRVQQGTSQLADALDGGLETLERLLVRTLEGAGLPVGDKPFGKAASHLADLAEGVQQKISEDLAVVLTAGDAEGQEDP